MRKRKQKEKFAPTDMIPAKVRENPPSKIKERRTGRDRGRGKDDFDFLESASERVPGPILSSWLKI